MRTDGLPERLSLLRAGRRSDAGAASVEFVLVAPIAMLVFLLLLQWVVRLEADRAVSAAAREGAVAAAHYDGTASDGKAVAENYLDRLGSHVSHRSVRSERSSDNAQVQVRAEVLALIPFMRVQVAASARQPVERFTP